MIRHLFGVPVVKSSSLRMNRWVPCREHKFGKGRSSLAYHNRIQKKWNKRFGVKQEKYAFAINDVALSVDPYAFLGVGKQVLYQGASMARGPSTLVLDLETFEQIAKLCDSSGMADAAGSSFRKPWEFY